MIAPDVEVQRTRFGYRAVIRIGRISLEAVRSNEEAARTAVDALYEEALFGCNRYAARAVKERSTRGHVNPETRRRTP